MSEFLKSVCVADGAKLYKFKLNEQVRFINEAFKVEGIGFVSGCVNPASDNKLWLIRVENVDSCGINNKIYPFNIVVIDEKNITSTSTMKGYLAGEYVAYDNGRSIRTGKFLKAEGRYAFLELKSGKILITKKVSYTSLLKIKAYG